MEENNKEKYTEEYGLREAKERPGESLVIFRTGLWKRQTQKGVPCLKGGLKNYWITVTRHTPSPEGGRHTAVLMLHPKEGQELSDDGIIVEAKGRDGTYFIQLYTNHSVKFGEFWGSNYGGYNWQIWPAKKYTPASPDFSLVVRTSVPKEEWAKRDSNVQRNPNKEIPLDSGFETDLKQGEYLEEPVESDPWDDDNEPF